MEETSLKMIDVPDKFKYDKESKSFYEFTPFGICVVNHKTLVAFYESLQKKFGSQQNFDDLVELLTELRLIEPQYFIDSYDTTTNQLRGLPENELVEQLNANFGDKFSSILGLAQNSINPMLTTPIKTSQTIYERFDLKRKKSVVAMA